MSRVAAQTRPRFPSAKVVHRIRGRLRLHLEEWTGVAPSALEREVRRIAGVSSASANEITRNVVVAFDPAITDEHRVLAAARRIRLDRLDVARPRRSVHHERSGRVSRARIGIHGLDHDPEVAGRAVERLSRLRGVSRVSVSFLTGRLLVEYEAHETTLDDLLSELTGFELPELADEAVPSHPLDRGPIVQSSLRTLGAGLGIAVLVLQQLLGRRDLPGAPQARTAALLIGIVQGFPPVQRGLRRLVGSNLADPLLSLPGVVALTLSGSPIGLAVVAGEAVRTLTAAQERRSSWQRYEEQLEAHDEALPGRIIRLEAGERAPLSGTVLEGTGTALGSDGMPVSLAPGSDLQAGARVFGGPIVIRLVTRARHGSYRRPAETRLTTYDWYLRLVAPASLAFAVLNGLIGRSLTRAAESLLLLNARPAMVGEDSAELGAQARATRAGATIVGARPLRMPDVLLIDSPRTLIDGFDLGRIVPARPGVEPSALLELAASVAGAAGSPWGSVLWSRETDVVGEFDGSTATAEIGGTVYSLGLAASADVDSVVSSQSVPGEYVLVLCRGEARQALAFLRLRPRLAKGVTELVSTCKRHGIRLAMFSRGDQRACEAVAERAQIELLEESGTMDTIRALHTAGQVVGFTSDSGDAASAFAASDLAIGLSPPWSGHFAARVDVLVPDLVALSATMEAASRRCSAIRDGVFLSVASNVLGLVGAVRGPADRSRAQLPVFAATLSALGDAYLRTRGGETPRSVLSGIAEPKPWRWGRQTAEDVLQSFGTPDGGLTGEMARARRGRPQRRGGGSRLLHEVIHELSSPLTGLFAAGAALSFLASAPIDVAIILGTLLVNVSVAVWQEHRAGQASELLETLSRPAARVLREHRPVLLPASEVVPGDILLLESGDRVAADARVLNATGLEVDESSLTGESLPTRKTPDGGTDVSRIVLAGTDIVTGVGSAVVVAIGPRTLMGATAAALAADGPGQSPLEIRLSKMLQQMLPVAAAGSVATILAGVVHANPLAAQLAVGVSLFLAAVPEGVPLLARFGEAVVARRLSAQGALVRRVGAVEALGRVDFACVDKTGTLTKGRLELTLVASTAGDGGPPKPDMAPELQQILVAGALASPPLGSPGATAHTTDAAVLQGAVAAGLAPRLGAPRLAEIPFEATRGFHATLLTGRLFLKGAPEVLAPRCRPGPDEDANGRTSQRLLDLAGSLASRGLRILMVAEGSPDVSAEDPQGLTPLGFLGISDPLRSGVTDAVRRCTEAGIRVVMLTGDHPATAGAIAAEAGIMRPGQEILTGQEMAELDGDALAERLERATVIARVTPLDKVRIIESLRARGHIVAMTGDGVNDAPALRLADVGVALETGTEVARQAADLIMMAAAGEPDFSTLVQAFIEGRTFWRNMRRSLDLLVGGNLAEIWFMVGASLTGLPGLTTRQILLVNMITDVLPGIALVMQEPEERDAALLAREGTAALDRPLRNAIVRRGIITAGPSLAAFLLALRTSDFATARTVGFASIATTQMAQTLDAAGSAAGPNRAIIAGIGGSGVMLAAAFLAPPLRTLVDVTPPGPFGLALVAGSTLAAAALSRLFPARQSMGGQPRTLLPAPAEVRLLPG